MQEAETIHRTFVADCPSCQSKSVHTDEDWDKHHPNNRHGYLREIGWSKEGLSA
jgi:hypothetical protein